MKLEPGLGSFYAIWPGNGSGYSTTPGTIILHYGRQ